MQIAIYYLLLTVLLVLMFGFSMIANNREKIMLGFLGGVQYALLIPLPINNIPAAIVISLVGGIGGAMSVCGVFKIRLLASKIFSAHMLNNWFFFAGIIGVSLLYLWRNGIMDKEGIYIMLNLPIVAFVGGIISEIVMLRLTSAVSTN